ncbi:unnamed protein product [Didymodactylos carnosus]|uniref:CCHC-type domain-containing protein n=1 Tax=Didymodactylos carnosus TaxID=1234261 RepID=A0A814N7K1_9BILA|nr:unnamed protein product [Didymodactylos carnosus]CAF3852194.1 unnamed protein product [Didymodactylos carnosus]
MEDNPPDGGTIHRKRKNSTQRDDERRSKSRATNNPQRQQHPQLTKPPAQLAPLILQGVKITRFQLSKLITKTMPDVKLINIQSNKNNTFTIFASDVNSYNRILRDLAKQKFDNENDVKVYIPRSIQKVLDTDKQAFLKRVDVEITTPEIENALTAAGFKYEKLERLQNFKKDGPGTTVKLTFADSFNRDTIVRTGLHLQHLTIIAEPAKYLTKPIQCYKCLGFGHISKYCRATQQVCTRCTEAHNSKDCDKDANQIKYKNCEVGGPRHQNSSATSPVDIVEAVFKTVIAILQPTLAKILEKLELTTTTASPASTTGTAIHQNHMDLVRQILIHAKMRHLTKEACLFAVKEAQKPNKKLSTIARALKCDRRTVSRVLVRFSETGLLTDQHRPGRPTALTEDQQKMLDRYITKNPTATANQLSNYVFDEFGIRVSGRTLQRYRRAPGFCPRKQQVKVKSTEGQIEKRHFFALEHQNTNIKK